MIPQTTSSNPIGNSCTYLQNHMKSPEIFQFPEISQEPIHLHDPLKKGKISVQVGFQVENTPIPPFRLPCFNAEERKTKIDALANEDSGPSLRIDLFLDYFSKNLNLRTILSSRSIKNELNNICVRDPSGKNRTVKEAVEHTLSTLHAAIGSLCGFGFQGSRWRHSIGTTSENSTPIVTQEIFLTVLDDLTDGPGYGFIRDTLPQGELDNFLNLLADTLCQDMRLLYHPYKKNPDINSHASCLLQRVKSLESLLKVIDTFSSNFYIAVRNKEEFKRRKETIRKDVETLTNYINLIKPLITEMVPQPSDLYSLRGLYTALRTVYSSPKLFLSRLTISQLSDERIESETDEQTTITEARGCLQAFMNEIFWIQDGINRTCLDMIFKRLIDSKIIPMEELDECIDNMINLGKMIEKTPYTRLQTLIAQLSDRKDLSTSDIHLRGLLMQLEVYYFKYLKIQHGKVLTDLLEERKRCSIEEREQSLREEAKGEWSTALAFRDIFIESFELDRKTREAESKLSSISIENTDPLIQELHSELCAITEIYQTANQGMISQIEIFICRYCSSVENAIVEHAEAVAKQRLTEEEQAEKELLKLFDLKDEREKTGPVKKKKQGSKVQPTTGKSKKKSIAKKPGTNSPDHQNSLTVASHASDEKDNRIFEETKPSSDSSQPILEVDRLTTTEITNLKSAPEPLELNIGNQSSLTQRILSIRSLIQNLKYREQDLENPLCDHWYQASLSNMERMLLRLEETDTLCFRKSDVFGETDIIRQLVETSLEIIFANYKLEDELLQIPRYAHQLQLLVKQIVKNSYIPQSIGSFVWDWRCVPYELSDANSCVNYLHTIQEEKNLHKQSQKLHKFLMMTERINDDYLAINLLNSHKSRCFRGLLFTNRVLELILNPDSTLPLTLNLKSIENFDETFANEVGKIDLEEEREEESYTPAESDIFPSSEHYPLCRIRNVEEAINSIDLSRLSIASWILTPMNVQTDLHYRVKQRNGVLRNVDLYLAFLNEKLTLVSKNRPYDIVAGELSLVRRMAKELIIAMIYDKGGADFLKTNNLRHQNNPCLLIRSLREFTEKDYLMPPHWIQSVHTAVNYPFPQREGEDREKDLIFLRKKLTDVANASKNRLEIQEGFTTVSRGNLINEESTQALITQHREMIFEILSWVRYMLQAKTKL